MDLWWALAGLVALQSVTWVGYRSVAVTSFAGRWRLPGPGYRFLSPWPGSLGVVLAGVPFVANAEELVAAGPLSHFASSLASADRRVPRDPEARVEVDGNRVLIEGRAFLRASSPAQAVTQAGAVLEALRDPAGVPRESLKRSFDVRAFQEVHRTLRARHRLLRWTCELIFLVWAIVVPALGVSFGFGSAWGLAWPLLLSLHVFGVCFLGWAFRREEARTHGWRTRLFSAAVYPPSLLREPAVLLADGLARFDPLCALEGGATGEERARALRRALAETRYGSPAALSTERAFLCGSFLASRRSLISKLAEELEVDPESLAGPSRLDGAPGARYCPLCESPFRPAFRECPDCALQTKSWDEA